MTAEVNPEKQPVTRREFLNLAWLASLGFMTVSVAGVSILFAMPRFKEGEFGGVITIGKVSDLPAVDQPPENLPKVKLWISNTEEGLQSIYKVEVRSETKVFPIQTKKLLIATGSDRKSLEIIQSLGHTVEEPVPSLFTFNITDPRIAGLAGVSVEDVTLRMESIVQRGQLLITHWGLSGPVVRRVSAWGAPELHERKYRAKLVINWLGDTGFDQAMDVLQRNKDWQENRRKKVSTQQAFSQIPARLWKQLVQFIGEKNWGDVSKAELRQLARIVAEQPQRRRDAEQTARCRHLVVVAMVVPQAEAFVGLEGGEAVAAGLHQHAVERLGREAGAASFLREVEEYAASLVRDRRERGVQLLSRGSARGADTMTGGATSLRRLHVDLRLDHVSTAHSARLRTTGFSSPCESNQRRY